MSPAPINDDTALAATPALVKAAGGVIVMMGAFGVLHVVQLFGILVVLRGPFVVVPPAMALEAAAALVFGVGFARARAWAPWPAVVVAFSLCATSGAWFVFALTQGLFTLFGMLVPGMSTVALVLSLVARRSCSETALARGRLMAEGLDLGV